MALLMSIAEYASNQKATQVRGDFHVGVLVKVLNQAKADGQAAQKLIASAAPVRRSQEPGKGSLVDLTA
jgi:hypothetical protein